MQGYKVAELQELQHQLPLFHDRLVVLRVVQCKVEDTVLGKGLLAFQAAVVPVEDYIPDTLLQDKLQHQAAEDMAPVQS